VAKVQIVLPDEFLLKLSSLGKRFDEIAPRVLEAGAKPLHQRCLRNLEAVIGKDTRYPSRSTGALLASVGITPAQKGPDDEWDIRVGIGRETDESGVANALKGMVLEYGKSGQPPKPWLKPAKSASRQAVLQAMQEELRKELGP